MNALRQCCHAKIQDRQRASAQQLQALKVQLPHVVSPKLYQFTNGSLQLLIDALQRCKVCAVAMCSCDFLMKSQSACHDAQDTLEGRLQEAGSEIQSLSQDLEVAKSLVSTLEVSLQRADSSCKSAEQEAAQLRRQLEGTERATASAEKRAQQAESERQLACSKAQEQQSTISAAISELEARLTHMASTAAEQRDEIASLRAIVQACC
jgi:DNA repair exonuclease SbcCD ATPase subunit